MWRWRKVNQGRTTGAENYFKRPQKPLSSSSSHDGVTWLQGQTAGRLTGQTVSGSAQADSSHFCVHKPLVAATGSEDSLCFCFSAVCRRLVKFLTWFLNVICAGMKGITANRWFKSDTLQGVLIARQMTASNQNTVFSYTTSQKLGYTFSFIIFLSFWYYLFTISILT